MQKDGITNHVRKFIESHYSLENGSGGKYINWIKTEPNLDEELLHKVLNGFEVNPPSTLPTSSTFLKQRYLVLKRGATPLPKPICSSCYARIDMKDMEEHMPLCSYTAMTSLTSQQRKDLMSIHALIGEKEAHRQGKEWINDGK